VKTCRRAIITRPPWSDDREAQTKRTSGIGDDEPLDDDRSVLSPGPISSPESRASPVMTNRVSLSSVMTSLQPLSGGKLLLEPISSTSLEV
jgi:hypothetical protein